MLCVCISKYHRMHVVTYFAGEGKKKAPLLTEKLRKLGIFTDKNIPEIMDLNAREKLEQIAPVFSLLK